MWLERCPTEGFARGPIDHEAEVDIVIRETHEVEGVKAGSEHFLEEGSVLGTEPEGDHGADISEHRVQDIRFELMEMLIGENEANAEFAQFRDGVRKRKRRETLKLIDVEEEGATCREWQFRP